MLCMNCASLIILIFRSDLAKDEEHRRQNCKRGLACIQNDFTCYGICMRKSNHRSSWFNVVVWYKKFNSDITENESCGPYLYFALRYEMKVSREHQCSKGLDCIQDTKWSLVGKCKKPEEKDEDKGKIFIEDWGLIALNSDNFSDLTSRELDGKQLGSKVKHWILLF